MTTPAQGTHHTGRFERTWVLREQRESIERLQHEMGKLLGADAKKKLLDEQQRC